MPESDEGSDPEQAPGDRDRQLALEKATDTPWSHIIADIVGHPQGAPSVTELAYMNPSLTTDAIRHHLGILKEVGVVAEHTVEPSDRVRGAPDTVYSVTDDAREPFDQHNLFPPDAWTRQYERVQKPSEIQEIEELPRPAED